MAIPESIHRPTTAWKNIPAYVDFRIEIKLLSSGQHNFGNPHECEEDRSIEKAMILGCMLPGEIVTELSKWMWQQPDMAKMLNEATLEGSE